MTNSLTKSDETKLDEFKRLLNAKTIRSQIEKCLGDNAGAFLSSMIDLYSGDTYLQTCSPQDVVAECIKAAALKLPIVKSLGLAYVVAYKNKKKNKMEPNLIIGYKGLIQLAQRTGQYKCINTDSVYEGELKGFDRLSGEIDLSGERINDNVIGYFAYIRLISGFEKVLYMTKDEIIKWTERYSLSYKSEYSPWNKEFDKMAQKTVLRRLIGTYGSMSIEMAQVIEKEDNKINPKMEIEANANKGNQIGFNKEIIEEPIKQLETETIKQNKEAETVPIIENQLRFEAEF